MKPTAIDTWVLDLVSTWWTPAFVLLFIAIVAYAVWPRNTKAFEAAARMPLED